MLTVCNYLWDFGMRDTRQYPAGSCTESHQGFKGFYLPRLNASDMPDIITDGRRE